MDYEIAKSFALYANKTDSDYFVKIRGQVIPTLATLLTADEEVEYTVYRSHECAIYRNEFINKLSPDNIDSREFWKMATDNFPLFSISGGMQKIKSVFEANTTNFISAVNLGCIDEIHKIYQNNPTAKMLEIGPGHGCIKNFVKELYGDENYWAIDVCPLFDHPRIYQTDGKNIPDTIPNPLDMVYSVNVFQHLSKNQRTSYYKQVYEILKVGGVFIFGMFVRTEENKDWACWGTKDEDGKFYCNFFRQFTEIDSIEVLKKEIESVGFSLEHISPAEEQCHYLTFKCVKLNS